MESFEWSGHEPGSDDVAEFVLSGLIHDEALSTTALNGLIEQSNEEVSKGGKGVVFEDPNRGFSVSVSDEQVTIAYPGVGELFSLTIQDAQRVIDTHDGRFNEDF